MRSHTQSGSRAENMRSAMRRSNTRPLLIAVLILQALTLVLIGLKPEAEGYQALRLALLVPLATFLITNIMGKIWPVDRALLILVLLLCSLGIITLSDVCRSDTTPKTQALYALLGVAAMFVGVIFIRQMSQPGRNARYFLMALGVGALLSPWALGRWYQGARNWVYIGPLSGQPSEFMKPVFIIILAAVFANRPRFVQCIPGIAFAACCCAVLLSERDLGALLLYFLTTVLMYYAATSNFVVTMSGLGMGAVSAVAACRLFPYVQARVDIWKNPWSDPLNSGYQIVQALIAIGSGGLFGMGLGLGMPRNVPLYHSDFVFTSIAEEFGLVFSVGLMAIYVFLIFRGLIIAMNARTSFLSLISFGLVTILGLQALLIIGGNTKLIPLTGVTLPLVSYGGSSLVATMFSMGLLLGISSMNAQDEERDIERISLREDGDGI